MSRQGLIMIDGVLLWGLEVGLWGRNMGAFHRRLKKEKRGKVVGNDFSD